MISADEMTGNFAYIDNQNLYMATHRAEDPWDVDMRRFRVYLREKYNVVNAYLFMGVFGTRMRDASTQASPRATWSSGSRSSRATRRETSASRNSSKAKAGMSSSSGNASSRRTVSKRLVNAYTTKSNTPS